MDAPQHQEEILHQFTHQAEPFLRCNGNGKEVIPELIFDCTLPRTTDSVLDFAFSVVADFAWR